MTADNARPCVNRIEIERELRKYLRGEYCGFPFMLFSRLTQIDYADVLRVSEQFDPYAVTAKFHRTSKAWFEQRQIANEWPSGALSALAAVCTMEANRRQGLAI